MSLSDKVILKTKLMGMSNLLKVTLASDSVVLAIGDIHGCLAHLESILSYLTVYQGAMIFLGDYVDRGPSSIGVIERMIRLQQTRPNTYFLMGNHDQDLLNWHENQDADTFESEVSTAIHEYKLNYSTGIPTDHHGFLKNLLFYHKINNLVFAHGGISHRAGRKPLEEQPCEDFLLTRGVAKTWKGEIVVSGHTIVENAGSVGRQILLDTGCYHTGILTCGILDSKKSSLLGTIQTVAGEMGVRENWLRS